MSGRDGSTCLFYIPFIGTRLTYYPLFCKMEIAKWYTKIRNQQEKQRKYDLFGIFFM